MIKKIVTLILTLFFISSLYANEKYNRKSFGYKSYKTSSKIGFYTGEKCDTNIDHVVSLKDAHISGAKKWTSKLKNRFANDKQNHVFSCIKINSSKGSYTPDVFLRRGSDGKGLEYKIINPCKYLKIYYTIKMKYNLSFDNNNLALFKNCLIDKNN